MAINQYQGFCLLSSLVVQLKIGAILKLPLIPFHVNHDTYKSCRDATAVATTGGTPLRVRQSPTAGNPPESAGLTATRCLKFRVWSTICICIRVFVKWYKRMFEKYCFKLIDVLNPLNPP